MVRRRKKPVQLDLFGNPIEHPAPARSNKIIPLDFETHAVRMVVIKGEPWWVAADACRVLEIGSASLAVNGRADRPGDGLDDDEKGVAIVNTPSGSQEMLVVNESGLYSLIFRSRKPEAKRFRKWVTSEVIPAIRRTGTYTARPLTRVDREAKRLGCDKDTAKARCEQFVANRASNHRLAKAKAKRRHFRDWHNAGYQGQFNGRKASDLRKALGMKRGTPLDRMDAVPLSINFHAKALATRLILEAERDGRPIPLDEQPKLLQTIAEEMAKSDLERFGPDSTYDVVENLSRGPILDIVRRSLN